MILDFNTTIAAAWQQVNGSKKTFWVAIAFTHRSDLCLEFPSSRQQFLNL